MMDQSADRYRVLLTDDPGYPVWELERGSELILAGENVGYGSIAQGDTPEELEGALEEILRSDLRDLRRKIEQSRRILCEMAAALPALLRHDVGGR
jgi:hypothetical protein